MKKPVRCEARFLKELESVLMTATKRDMAQRKRKGPPTDEDVLGNVESAAKMCGVGSAVASLSGGVIEISAKTKDGAIYRVAFDDGADQLDEALELLTFSILSDLCAAE